jgi:multiple sugar transport system ATP-binding protein
MNMIEATLERANGTLTAVAGNQRIHLTDETVAARPALRSYEGGSIILGIRPEDLEDAELARDIPADQRLRGEVQLREALGSELMVHFTVDATPAVTEDVRELQRDAGAEGGAGIQTESGAVMVGRFGARSRVKTGETVDVAVDTRALHFFDGESGLGIYDQTKGAGS